MVLAATLAVSAPCGSEGCDCGGIVPPCSRGAWESSGNTLLHVRSVIEFAV
jgi:hypothetical protein